MEKDKNINFRPPIVTLMGHVDHGKTTLLDAIRKSNVVAKEHGGITQHIGAYQVTSHNQLITFVDTPGHAAFEDMRSRGAEVADIVILVVAANEGVKPQTAEAIKHIKKAQRPIIVALTKTDLANINIDKITKQLQTEGVIVENFGGEVPLCQVAAPEGRGIANLLELILLVWQLSPEPSLPNDPLEAVVIESFLDKNRGPIATVIVKKGTLKISQKIQVNGETTTIRALIGDKGQTFKEAKPSQPVEILGFRQLLEMGTVVQDFTTTKTQMTIKHTGLSEIIAKSQQAHDKFKVIIKADVTGSQEAILTSLPEEIFVVSSGVGEINLNDISTAKIAQAPILAFNVRVNPQILKTATREGVIVKSYQVIYELLSDMKDVVTSFQQAREELKIFGRAKVIATFNIEGKKIAGAQVTNGKIKIGDQIILKRNGQIQEAKITSLKKFKKDIQSVSAGQECGVGFDQNLDFEAGDVLESLG